MSSLSPPFRAQNTAEEEAERLEEPDGNDRHQGNKAF